MFTLLVLVYIFTPSNAEGQNVQYKYDRADRVIQETYPVSHPGIKVVNYTYDKDGNRLSKSATVIDSTPPPLLSPIDSTDLVQNTLLIYPNPSDGNFKGSLFSVKTQDITIEIFTIDGKQVYSYTASNISGYYNFTINISPLAPGTYALHLKGKYVLEQRKIVILK